MFQLIAAHPYLYLGILLVAAVVSYMLFETKGSSGQLAHGKRTILGSLIMLLALLLQYSSVIDGVAGSFGDFKEKSRSVSTLHTLCKDDNSLPVIVFGTDPTVGCPGATFMYWFNYLMLLAGLFMLIYGLVHINT